MVVEYEVGDDIIWVKGVVPSRNKHLKPSNVFKDYGWFITSNDKHALLHPDVRKNMIYLGLGLDSLDC